MKVSAERIGVSLATAATIGLIAWPALEVVVPPAAVAISLALATTVGSVAFRRLPEGVDGTFRRRERERREGSASWWRVTAARPKPGAVRS